MWRHETPEIVKAQLQLLLLISQHHSALDLLTTGERTPESAEREAEPLVWPRLSCPFPRLHPGRRGWGSFLPGPAVLGQGTNPAGSACHAAGVGSRRRPGTLFPANEAGRSGEDRF